MNIQTRTAHARTEHYSSATDKGAISNHPGNPDMVTFGRWEGDRFVVRFFDGSKSYKTQRGAERAIAKWMAS